MSYKPRLLVIIPAFNEEESLPLVVKEARRNLPFADLLVIDDGSTDSTAEVARGLGVLLLVNRRNQGIGYTVQRGWRYALERGYEVAMQVDGDGQHDTAYASRLLEAIAAGADLAIGSRFLNGTGYEIPKLRRLAMRFVARWISRMAGQPIADCTSGFRAAGPRAIRLFAERYAQDYPEPVGLVTATKAALRVVEAPVNMRERQAGRSSITGLKGLWYVLRVMWLAWRERYAPLPTPVREAD